MPESRGQLNSVLHGFKNFLADMDLAPAKQRAYLVRWVREFLLYTREHGGYTFEPTVEPFMTQINGRVDVKPWQIQQAADAVRSCRYQDRAENPSPEGIGPPSGRAQRPPAQLRRSYCEHRDRAATRTETGNRVRYFG